MNAAQQVLLLMVYADLEAVDAALESGMFDAALLTLKGAEAKIKQLQAEARSERLFARLRAAAAQPTLNLNPPNDEK